MTLAEARIEVMRRLAVSDDGAGSPELLMQTSRMLASIQRQLCLEHAPLRPRRRLDQLLQAGRRFYPLPTAVEGIEEIHAITATAGTVVLDWRTTPTEEGVAVPGYALAAASAPTLSVASVTVSAGGTGFINGQSATFSAPEDDRGHAAFGVVAADAGGVITGIVITDPGSGYQAPPTITVENGTGATLVAVIEESDQLLLSPSPAEPGTLRTFYREVPAVVLADADKLVFDAEVVIASTAAFLAPAYAPGMKDALQALARSSMQSWLSRAAPAAQTMSLTPLRLRGGR